MATLGKITSLRGDVIVSSDAFTNTVKSEMKSGRWRLNSELVCAPSDFTKTANFCALAAKATRDFILQSIVCECK